MTKMTKQQIIKINEQLGTEFKTAYGLGGNRSNLDYALSLENSYDLAKEINRGQPFIDGNKRTALMVYMFLTTNKTYKQILKDYYDLFLSLSK